MYLWMMINTLYKNYLKKPIATFLAIGSTPLITNLLAQLVIMKSKVSLLKI